MSDRLHVDLDNVERSSRRVKSIRSMLGDAQADAQRLEGMIPVRKLRDTVIDFSEGWEVRRKNLMENVQLLSEQLEAISEGFESLDQNLASRLQESLEGESA